MSNWKNEAQALKSLVDKGLYVDNLRRMEQKSRELIMISEYPTVFFVLETVFFDLKMAWDDRPVTTEEYDYVQSGLARPIQDLLASVQSDMKDEMIIERLDAVVREFIEMRPRL